MHAITLVWEDWRAVIDALRVKGLAYMLQHADHLERTLDATPTDHPTVRMSLSDDLYLRSFTWARLRLGIPLPPLAR